MNTYQAGYTLWRKDRKTLEDGIITSYIDRVTTDRRTSAPTGESTSTPTPTRRTLAPTTPSSPSTAPATSTSSPTI
ncbi:MAG: hypothetical protein U1U88_001593 [Lawsonella clevelandensis]